MTCRSGARRTGGPWHQPVADARSASPFARPSPPEVAALSTATGLRYNSPEPTSQSNTVFTAPATAPGMLGCGHEEDIGALTRRRHSLMTSIGSSTRSGLNGGLTLSRSIGTILDMAPRLVNDSQLIERLSDLFGRSGFDGASLADIAAATGLQKSSLYHRFSGGKQQMAAEVVAAVGDRFTTSILAPLDSQEPLDERVRAVGRNLDRYYERGARSCLLDMLSVGEPGPDATSTLTAVASAWIAAFAAVAQEAGADRSTSIGRAQDAIATIEGALVIARVTGDKRPFRRAIDRLEDVLLAPAQH
jgi:AcrR family transcriptional regulator